MDREQVHKILRGIANIILCLLVSSCNIFDEDLPSCRLTVRFVYDYNMLSTDAFPTQVDKVDLYVFDENGLFVMKQTGERVPAEDGDYQMEVSLPTGKYQFMAWAGVHDSYEIPTLVAGRSTKAELELKLQRTSSKIINHELEPLWYGQPIEVDFTGGHHQTETIHLIKDTNKLRFAFQYAVQTEGTALNVDDYTYEVIESNGYLDADNALLKDEELSYQPYYKEQKNVSAVAVELNTMRLMANRATRFVVTEKATGKPVFDINLTDYLLMTEMEGHKWGAQEYLDRQDEYVIVFFLSSSWQAVQININGWTWYVQDNSNGI